MRKDPTEASRQAGGLLNVTKFAEEGIEKLESMNKILRRLDLKKRQEYVSKVVL